MIIKRLISTLILVISTTLPALAQTPAAPPKTDEQKQAQKELERKALSMLDDVIKESDSFKHAENRIRIKNAAAFILWKHDEARARTLFKEAMASLMDLLKEPPADESPEAQRMFEGPRQLRAEMIQTLAQRDPRMARELSRTSRSSSAQRGAPNAGTEDYERQMDLTLAMQVASEDPKLAAEIARESMTTGFSYQLPGLVAAIRVKDPEIAARLASDILAKLRSAKLESNGEARGVAVSLLQTATDTEVADTAGPNKIQTPLLDQMALGELAELVTSEALRSPSQNAEMLSSLQSMMPVVERYAPARAAQLRSKVPEPEKEKEKEIGDGPPVTDPGEALAAKYSPVYESGSVDELLAAAAKAPVGWRDTLYQQAASKLLAAGDADGARRIITEKMQDSPEREQVLRDLEKTAAIAAAAQGKIEDSRKLLASLKSVEERVNMLVELAASAAQKGEKKTALRFLDEARGMIASRAKNVNQLAAQLVVARGYARLDPSRSLAILEPMVDQLNELLAAATVLGGFFVEELVRDDEIMLGALSMLSGLAVVQQYSEEITSIASADFERSRALVDRFQRDEIRTFMRLILAQTILAPTASTSPSGMLTTIDTTNSPVELKTAP